MTLRRRAAIWWAGLLLVCGVLARPAAAEPVRIDFYITVTQAFGDMVPLAGVPLGPGDRVRGSLVYDPFGARIIHRNVRAGLPDGPPALEVRQPAGFIHLDLGSGIRLPLAFPEGGLFAARREPPFDPLDQIHAFGGTPDVAGFESVRAELFFLGDYFGAQGDLFLPTTTGAFVSGSRRGNVMVRAFQIGVDPPFDSGTQELFGTIEPIPEPGTLLLLAGGGAALLARRRRQRPARESTTDITSGCEGGAS